MFYLKAKVTIGLRLVYFLFVLPLAIASGCTENRSQTIAAYKSLNRTLRFSSEFIHDQSARLYSEIKFDLDDYRTMARSMEYQPKIRSIKKHSDEMVSFVKGIKSELMVKAGISDSSNASTLMAPLTEFTNRDLEKEIIERFRIYIDEVFNKDSMSSPIYKKQLESMSLEFQRLIISEKINEGSLLQLPLITALSFLDNYEIQIRRIEYELVRFIYVRSKPYDEHNYTKFSFIMTLDKTLIKSGETIELIGGMGEFTLKSRPLFIIDQKKVEPGPDGVVLYKIKSNKPGKYAVPVKVEFTQSDGSKDTVFKVLNYEVVEN